jgi:phosphate transport system permease protein
VTVTDPTVTKASAGGASAARPRAARSGPRRRTSSLLAMGEPMVWLMGGALALALLMVLGLLGHVIYEGGRTFWPGRLERFETKSGPFLGEVTTVEDYTRAGATEPERRWLVRTGNFDVSGTHFEWVSEGDVAGRSQPEWALILERRSWGRFYGEPVALVIGGGEQRFEGP